MVDRAIGTSMLRWGAHRLIPRKATNARGLRIDGRTRNCTSHLVRFAPPLTAAQRPLECERQCENPSGDSRTAAVRCVVDRESWACVSDRDSDSAAADQTCGSCAIRSVIWPHSEQRLPATK